MSQLPPDLDELLRRVPLEAPDRARQCLGRLIADPGDVLAMVRLAPLLADVLASAADPDGALVQLDRFVQSRGASWELYQMFVDRPALLSSFIQVVSSSPYLADVLVRNPEYLDILSGAAERPLRSKEQMRRELDTSCAAFQSAESRLNAIRRFRRREILRIGHADLEGRIDLEETTSQLSALADVVIEGCLNAVAADHASLGLAVLALGKLGGGELNYSSDIDLVFLVRDAADAPRATRVALDLTRVLGEFSEEGFLYRVDLRLRPFGSAGALVASMDLLENYLARQAHPAERQAMLRARPVAGQVHVAAEFLARITPLLFADEGDARRHVRALKMRIERQLRPGRGGESNVKLAPGGIRDIEFIVQALQLESGRDRPVLRTGHTLTALRHLAHHGLILAEDAALLREAYLFLRAIEHRLQLMNNQQVHHLPADGRMLRVLAGTLGFRGAQGAEQLRRTYQDYVTKVREIFGRLLPEDGKGNRSDG